MTNNLLSGMNLLYLSIGMFFSLISCQSEIIKKTEGKIIEPVQVKSEINLIGQWVGEGDKERLLIEFVNEYEFLNQDVKVNLKMRDDVYKASDEAQFIVEQLKKPVADWDIIARIHANYQQVATILNDPLWGEKYLVNFSEVPGFLESHKPFINTKMYKERYGNLVFGPHNEGQLTALYVNTDVAKKMGITVKQYGMTFDDYLGYIKAANEYNKSHDYIAPVFEDVRWIHSELIFKQMFFSLMDSYEQILDTRFTPEKQQAIEKCYKAFEELSKYSPILKERLNINWGRDNVYPLEDKCLFFPNYTFMYPIWKMKGKDKMYKMMPCELPVFRPSITYMGGYVANWGVLKNAPHKEEAIKLMMFWCTPEIAEKWVRYTKSPSGVIGNLTITSFGVDPFEDFMYTIDAKYQGKMMQELDNQYILGEKNYKIPYRVIEVLEGRMTANEAMDELKSKLVN